MIVVFMDFLVFILMVHLAGMVYMDIRDFRISADHKIQVESNRGSWFIFMTDGIVCLAYGVKFLFGIYYLFFTIKPPAMDYKYIMDNGKYQWRMKRVKQMRMNFKNYALASNILSTFIFFHTLVLFCVLFNI